MFVQIIKSGKGKFVLVPDDATGTVPIKESDLTPRLHKIGQSHVYYKWLVDPKRPLTLHVGTESRDLLLHGEHNRLAYRNGAWCKP